MKNALYGASVTVLLFAAMLWMNPRKTVNADQVTGIVGRYTLQSLTDDTAGKTTALVDTATGRVWFFSSVTDPKTPTLASLGFNRLCVDGLTVDPAGETACKLDANVTLQILKDRTTP